MSEMYASDLSREVANLTEIKNPHTPVYGVKEFVCLSVCLPVVIYAPFAGGMKFATQI